MIINKPEENMSILNTVMAFVVGTGIFGIGLCFYAFCFFVFKERKTPKPSVPDAEGCR